MLTFRKKPAFPMPDREGHSLAVRRMFARIAGRYDFMNHLLSANIDLLWRTRAARACGPAEKVLDLCMGSGDMAMAWMKAHRDGLVVGVDFCREMMDRVRNKLRGISRTILMVQGDALQMPFPDSAFDAVLCAFGMRNLADVEMGLHEMARVCRSGGYCMVLDFFRPHRWIPRIFHATYGRYVIPLAGRWFGADANAYQYLHHSVRRFLSLDEFVAMMEQAGFHQIRPQDMAAGIATVVVGRRT